MSKSTTTNAAALLAATALASAVVTPATAETVAPEVTTPAAAAPVVPAVPKAPSKKSQADAIFAAKLVERTQGLYATNKEFRAAVLNAIKTDLGVSTASAATMYNSAKQAAEAANPAVGLGRDPKKEKAPSTGKRGRPAKAKEVDATAPVEGAPAEAVAATEVATEAAEPALA